jgi:Domain of unknown function (DUF222)
MVMAVDPAPPTLVVSVAVERVHDAIDDLSTSDVGEVRGHDVAEVDRAIARLESVKLRMIAAADRQGAGAASGMSGTPAWLAAHTRSWGAKAAADVALATALEDSLPLTQEALADGTVSTAHAAVIAGTAARLPESLTAHERTKVEVALVAQAKRVDPARLRRAARQALAAAERSAEEALAHEDAELRGEESRALSRVRLTLHDNHDGTVTGHFTVPALAGAILRKTIQQMVSPRRDRTVQADAHGPGAGVGHAPSAGADMADWEHRYGTAFVELLEHLPTERLSGKVAATVVVTIDHDQLRDSLGAAHLDTGHDLSASEARRLACSAGLLPVVLDGRSVPLDLGRTHRFFSQAQRVALATTYDECSADGCDRPFAWSELHHEDPWARGGATDLERAVPLCGFHHRRVHDPRYDHQVLSGPAGRKCVVLHRRT